MTISTTTHDLVQEILDQLQISLPDALEAAGLPAVVDWCYGQREVVGATKCPQIQVDAPDWDQPRRFGNDIQRDNNLVVVAVLASPDEELLARQLIGYRDVLCSVVENLPISPLLNVKSADSTPNFQFTGSSRWMRVAALDVEQPGRLRTKGAV